MNLLNKFVVATLPAVPKPIVRYFANRYIAGEELVDALHVVNRLNGRGMTATLDVLGEDIHERESAIAARDIIIDVLNSISQERIDSNVSIKLTQLGLKLDKNFCLDNARLIVSTAHALGNFVRIDMEDSTCTEAALRIYRRLRKEFGNVGIVLQAHLRRTEEDTKTLISDGLENFRLCKGIYVEPEVIAFKKREDINRNFIRVLELMLRNEAYVGIATHDDALIEAAYRMIAEMNLEKTKYEFQMLLGVRSELREEVLRAGHRLRIYVPFGRHWYQYSLRRFKENPQVAAYVVKALFDRSHSKLNPHPSTNHKGDGNG